MTRRQRTGRRKNQKGAGRQRRRRGRRQIGGKVSGVRR